MKLRVERRMFNSNAGLPGYEAAFRLEDISEDELVNIRKYGLAPLGNAIGVGSGLTLNMLQAPGGHIKRDHDVAVLDQACSQAASAIGRLPGYWQQAADWSGEITLPQPVIEAPWDN